MMDLRWDKPSISAGFPPSTVTLTSMFVSFTMWLMINDEITQFGWINVSSLLGDNNILTNPW